MMTFQNQRLLRIALRFAAFNLTLRLLLFGVGRLHELNIFSQQATSNDLLLV